MTLNLDALDRYQQFLGKRYPSVALSFERTAEKKSPVIVELGSSRSYVSGGNEGCMDDDPKYWNPDRPERWDWGAGIFSRVCAEIIAGTDASLHSVDPSPKAMRIARTITSGIDAKVSFHQTTSTDFLRSISEPIDLLYMDHHETCEEGAVLHRRDSELIVEEEILAPDGVILIDDVHTHGPVREQTTRLVRKATGKGELHHGKGKYSIPYLREQGFRILFEGYQVVMGR
ncbi:MAG: class I SAM-dependent methyltransferase [Deltaproteobacteria bacterium]|nr:class I SAM-dependent methyltransferase [Deltaproteobacteria bacterium]NND27783.1 class I SAM-dependent methyltransferase [Myxococcales bacterium]MBT8463853.1 class I SAM-dependent methyltransferase [Deltaproteobacteria bacterium]MBT8481223.1 class I SAM-dependent methyltransferase [Deltaproteobacteria bacterium]NNK06121.1 class I SAM-dependent methyltransferase [Myxococcales bacterium]